MKEEIRKILAMAKDGTISDEQAAELITELLREEKRSSPTGSARRTGRRPEGFIDPFFSLLRNTVSGAVEAVGSGLGASSALGGVFVSDLQDNTIHMSRCASPSGEDFTFKDNRVRMSSVAGLLLEHAQLTDNNFDASKVDDIHISHGDMTGCDVVASALNRLTIDQSHLADTEVSSSKCSHLTLTAGSTVEGARLRAGAFKEIFVGAGSTWHDVSFAGVQLRGLQCNDTRLDDLDMQGAQLTDVTLEHSHLHNVLGRGIRLNQTVLSHCNFDDVLLSAGEAWSWRTRGFDDVHFEACTLKKVLFSECRLVRTVIRNVDLQDLKLQGVELVDVTLDGNDAFLQAVGLGAANTTAPEHENRV